MHVRIGQCRIRLKIGKRHSGQTTPTSIENKLQPIQNSYKIPLKYEIYEEFLLFHYSFSNHNCLSKKTSQILNLCRVALKKYLSFTFSSRYISYSALYISNNLILSCSALGITSFSFPMVAALSS